MFTAMIMVEKTFEQARSVRHGGWARSLETGKHGAPLQGGTEGLGGADKLDGGAMTNPNASFPSENTF